MSATNPSFTAQSPQLSAIHGTLTAAFEAGDAQVHRKAEERALVDVLQSMYAALGAGDIDAFISHLTDDVVMDLYIPEEFHFRRHAEGKEAARALVLANFQLLELQAPEITSLVAQGDTVALMLLEKGTLRATGVSYAVQVFQRFQFRERKVARFTEIAAVV